MTARLLDQFLAQECTPAVRRLLEETIADASDPRPHLEFNRFEVTIKRNENTVLLEDVLDATDAGAEHLPLAELVDALGRQSA